MSRCTFPGSDMKITIWIRERNGVPTVRTDTRLEPDDTPFIQRTGRRIVNALEGENDKS